MWKITYPVDGLKWPVIFTQLKHEDCIGVAELFTRYAPEAGPLLSHVRVLTGLGIPDILHVNLLSFRGLVLLQLQKPHRLTFSHMNQACVTHSFKFGAQIFTFQLAIMISCGNKVKICAGKLEICGSNLRGIVTSSQNLPTVNFSRIKWKIIRLLFYA